LNTAVRSSILKWKIFEQFEFCTEFEGFNTYLNPIF
jgi:hypothetical protein